MKKKFLNLIVTITFHLIATNVLAETVHWIKDPRSPKPACTCQIQTDNESFKSAVEGVFQQIRREYPDFEENPLVYFDQDSNYTKNLTSKSTHPTYAQALQSCQMAIDTLINQGTCSPGSKIPALSTLQTNEVGARTQFFKLSASEQAQLDYALAMAEIESGNQFYRQIADIYERKSYEDEQILLELLHHIRPIQTIRINNKHSHKNRR